MFSSLVSIQNKIAFANLENRLRIVKLREIRLNFSFINSFLLLTRPAELTSTCLSVQNPVKPAYQTTELVNKISQCKNYSDISLDGMGLTNLAMDIVVNEAITEKRCTQLTLNNNKFTQDGAFTLATALKNNTVRDTVRFLFRFYICHHYLKEFLSSM